MDGRMEGRLEERSNMIDGFVGECMRVRMEAEWIEGRMDKRTDKEVCLV